MAPTIGRESIPPELLRDRISKMSPSFGDPPSCLDPPPCSPSCSPSCFGMTWRRGAFLSARRPYSHLPLRSPAPEHSLHHPRDDPHEIRCVMHRERDRDERPPGRREPRRGNRERCHQHRVEEKQRRRASGDEQDQREDQGARREEREDRSGPVRRSPPKETLPRLDAGTASAAAGTRGESAGAGGTRRRRDGRRPSPDRRASAGGPCPRRCSRSTRRSRAPLRTRSAGRRDSRARGPTASGSGRLPPATRARRSRSPAIAWREGCRRAAPPKGESPGGGSGPPTLTTSGFASR